MPDSDGKEASRYAWASYTRLHVRLQGGAGDLTLREGGGYEYHLARDGSSTDLSDLDEVMIRLEEFKAAVLQMESSPPGPAPGLAMQPFGNHRELPSPEPCRICLRLENVLQEFMAHRQYELTVSESHQAKHALRSGFCPVHTWQYEAIASRQGVCEAYADLLVLYASRLQALARDEVSLPSMERGIREMLPTQSSCEACQLAAVTEAEMAREIAQNLRDGHAGNGLVCAFHLRSVLVAGPEKQSAIRLLLEEAGAFERLAENMQNYTLKHAALRHHLSTHAEHEAAAAGLARLVGRRNTVAPWKIE